MDQQQYGRTAEGVALIRAVQRTLARVARMGEPLQSKWNPQSIQAELRPRGFELLEHLSLAELRARYFAQHRDLTLDGCVAIFE
jgi:hypothetical protein